MQKSFQDSIEKGLPLCIRSLEQKLESAMRTEFDSNGSKAVKEQLIFEGEDLDAANQSPWVLPSPDKRTSNVHISPNGLPEFPSAVLASLNDTTASPRSAALQAENPLWVIWLKVNMSVH